MPQSLARTTAFVYEGLLYSPEVAKLGRIVLDPRNPIETFCDVFPDQDKLTSASAISITPSIDLECIYNSRKNRSLGGALLRLFCGRLSCSDEQETRVAGEIKQYQLCNAEVHFKNACEQEDGHNIRIWLQENVIKPKVNAYMVVGYHTITNPKITNGSSFARAVNIQGDGANIVNMAVPGSSGMASVFMRTTTENQSRFQRQISAVGERLWAVQYRKVIYKLEGLLSGSKTKLKDGQWKMMWKVRGQDSSGEFGVEVDLGDAAEPEEVDSDDDEDEEAPEPPEPPERFVNKVPGTEVEEEFIIFHSTNNNSILDQEDNDSFPTNAPQNESAGGNSTEVLRPSEGEDDDEMGDAWNTPTVEQSTTASFAIDQPVGTESPSGSDGSMTGSRAGQKRTRGLDCNTEEIDVGDSGIVERDSKRLRGRGRH